MKPLSITISKWLLSAVVFALPASSFAAFSCTAKINSILIYGNGTVAVNHSGKNDVQYVCSMNGNYKGVTAATCAMWAATLSQIKKTGGNALFYYDVVSTCAAMATYDQAPVPTYIGDAQ